MAELTWLPLAEYSTKYRVSISTLRRKIKAEDIRYTFNDGKYYLLDTPPSSTHRSHRPSQDDDSAPVSAPKKILPPHFSPAIASSILSSSSDSPQLVAKTAPIKTTLIKKSSEFVVTDEADLSEEKGAVVDPVIEETNRLLTDLKRAYTQILQEKEQTISKLRAEVADLKTLVQILEEQQGNGDSSLDN